MKRTRDTLFRAVLIAGAILWAPTGTALPQTQDAPAPETASGAAPPAAAAAAAKEQAIRHKDRGDEFRAREDIAHAGEEYAKALALDRGFPAADRLLMARYMSWSGRIDAAIRELEAILAEEPGNADARIHLARCLSWSGDQDGSLAESSKVLAASPDSRDALLVRANALKWSGDPDGAKAIYRGLLERGDDFDTRLGLAYADLATGNVREARAEAGRLAPEYPYQEKELDGLFVEICKATRPTASAGYTYYRDSDGNRVGRYTLSARYRPDNWTLEPGYRHTEADDSTRDERADDVSLSAGTQLTDRLGVGAGIGATRSGRRDPDDVVTGHVRADMRVLGGTAGARVSREAFTDTAQIIENRIRFTNVTAYVDRPLPRRFSVFARFSYKDYSDANSSNDLLASIRHTLRPRNPVVGLGYRFRFLDFERESRGGYFDPSGFVSNAAFVNLSYDKGRFYTWLEPYGGYQAFRRSGARTHGWFAGGSGVLGYRLSGTAVFEITGEGGDDAGGTAAGFNYYMVGARLTATF